MDTSNFHTFSEYMKKEDNSLTASMEDYLEMIYRLSMETGFTRINELSEALNVQPPSATKMVQRLGSLNFLKYERYGVIILKENGRRMGEFLLKRHNTIEALLSLLGVPKRILLTETEKIEHTISSESMKCFEDYITFMENNPDILTKLDTYRNARSIAARN